MYGWAEDNDKQAVMDLWAEDFESYEPYFSWYFNTVYQPGLTLCDFAGPHLAAMLQISPYTLQLRGVALPVAYLVGVITGPPWRGQGRGKALLLEAQRRLESQGFAAALLYTDIPGFYAPLGYSHCYRQQQLNLSDAMLTQLAGQGSSQVSWREGDISGGIPALSAIYSNMTGRYDGYIPRSREGWAKFLGEHNCDQARLILAAGQAYLLYTLDTEKLQVIELGFADAPALTEALAEAAGRAKAAGLQRLHWPAPPDAPQLLPQLPPQCWQPKPFVMARLADCQSVLELFSAPPAVRQILARLDIATATRLIFGVTGALEENTGLTLAERSVLTELFPPLPLWINEYT